MEHLYPLLFEPNLHETVWGGNICQNMLLPWENHGK